jgi:hypothetical protein
MACQVSHLQREGVHRLTMNRGKLARKRGEDTTGSWTGILSRSSGVGYPRGTLSCIRREGIYQLDICEALGDHDRCPGITSLHAGDFDLGTVACNCPCHKKPESEVPQ